MACPSRSEVEKLALQSAGFPHVSFPYPIPLGELHVPGPCGIHAIIFQSFLQAVITHAFPFFCLFLRKDSLGRFDDGF